MLESLLRLLQESPLSLWGPFLLLLLCGLGLPLPEDIVLVVAGMLAQDDGRYWAAVAVLMYGGVLLGDSMIYFLGRHFGARLLAWRGTHYLFPPRKQSKVQQLFHRHGSMVLFIGRFLPGLRAPIFCSAGAMKVGYLRFLLLDGAAAMVSVPIFVWLGHWLWAKFDDDFKELNAAFSRTEGYTLWAGGGVVVAAVLTVWWIRRRRTGAVAP